MRSDELLFLCFLSIGLLCIYTAIFMTFYLRKHKISEIDRIVFGYEVPGDSIFYQGIRMMNYGGAFAWRWSAKRSHLLDIRKCFDKKFQRPSIICFWLVFIGVLSSIIAGVLHVGK